MKLYKIKNWDAVFENNRSRTVERLSWVAIPNRHDGENYSALITSKDGSELFAAWCLIVQVASKCQPRGTLLKGDGRPHDASSLSLKTRAPEKWFDKCLSYLESNTDWLDIQDIAGDCQVGDSQMPEDWQAGDEEGRDGKEGKNGTETHPRTVVFPSELDSDSFKETWMEWQAYRKQRGNSPKNWEIMFQRQLEFLKQFGPAQAITSLKSSMMNNYIGLFDPKGGQQIKKRSPHGNI